MTSTVLKQRKKGLLPLYSNGSNQNGQNKKVRSLSCKLALSASYVSSTVCRFAVFGGKNSSSALQFVLKQAHLAELLSEKEKKNTADYHNTAFTQAKKKKTSSTQKALPTCKKKKKLPTHRWRATTPFPASCTFPAPHRPSPDLPPPHTTDAHACLCAPDTCTADTHTRWPASVCRCAASA